MPFLGLLWPLIQSWWKVIAVVLVILAALGYLKYLHHTIDSLKAEVVELRTVIASANAKNKQLEDAAGVLSKKYEHQLENQQLEADKRLNTITDRIRKNETAKRIALQRELVELFNDSKPNSGPTPPAKQGDAGGTGPPKETVTLQDLLLVSAENDSNHIKCINQVHEWQNFWKDYEAQVRVVGGSP